MVIASRNPVHSVLFLILAFFNAAALFILLGAEFLALILLIVYVGAVAVLFLFVVMMLDIEFAELKRGAAAISSLRRPRRRDPCRRTRAGGHRRAGAERRFACAARNARTSHHTEALGASSTQIMSITSKRPG